ncbi:uncharacterized protein [Dysidea avara]|uniref:uncharacterized protein n=1 Tax=Dysidea avara TaxID=196820 RepID=UPI00331A25C8
MFLLLLLLLPSLLHTTTGRVYNVTPDDHCYSNTTFHHCHNLQYYLLNATKYFTSNTQLHFLPGLHHLQSDLIIQTVYNISLIGTTPDTVIQCNSSVGIVLTNITNLILTDITVRNCSGNYSSAVVLNRDCRSEIFIIQIGLLIKQCTNVQLRQIVIEENFNPYGIVGINILGNSTFLNVTNNLLGIIYNSTKDMEYQHHSLLIEHYYNSVSNFIPATIITFMQQSHQVNVSLTNSWLSRQRVTICFQNTGKSQSIFMAKSCHFTDAYNEFMIYIRSTVLQLGNAVQFDDCSFSNNEFDDIITMGRVIDVYNGPDIQIVGCNFHNNYNAMAFGKVYTNVPNLFGVTRIRIAKTTFSSSTGPVTKEFIRLQIVDLHLIGPIIFYNISNSNSIFRLEKSNATCYDYIEFKNTTARSIFRYLGYSFPKVNFFLFITENSIVNITQSNFVRFAFPERDEILGNYPLCYFQYLSDEQLDSNYIYHNYSIILSKNEKVFENNILMDLPITHCRWLPRSAFKTAMPFKVNSQYIRYANQSGQFNASRLIVKRKQICLCDNNMSHDCYRDLLGPIYPGQAMTLNIYLRGHNIPVGFVSSNNTIITVINDTDWLPSTACTVTNPSELTKTIKNGICATINYTTAFPTQRWCELFLKGFYDGGEVTDIYYIEQLPCPIGFIKINSICQCYPFLLKFRIKCNINDQTLLRHPNTWLAPTPHNNSYVYSLSLQCPFHYCLPHSSHLSFSTPNSQCQFNRSGILCGHCQQGLSTVFGSSHCQPCSNIYLFLIVPITIAGLMLVLLLFFLNLTVVDGTINAFILYVNIISINTTVFFPKVSKFTPAYIFVSIANLDLGIQTCFYNGMDDYAKIWLQLAFPFYLIFIAISLIIMSHYSNKIQRLTARRAIPVLATLFLLSYTKILLIVSSVLFHYSKLIHLPSEHSTIVWSVDANIPLFGVKFTILFVTCIALFLILLPFNITLLFTRTLSRYKFVLNFIPLLETYQGPYKMKYYYWTGMQLVIRVAIYGISSLDKNINLTIGVILLSTLAVFQGWIKPFKVTYKNIQELMFTINLHLLFVISMSSQYTMTVTNTMVAIAAVQFTFIIIYHIITYTCGGVIKHRIMATKNTLFGKLFNQEQVQHYDSEEDIPNVQGFNELQEPLMGFD